MESEDFLRKSSKWLISFGWGLLSVSVVIFLVLYRISDSDIASFTALYRIAELLILLGEISGLFLLLTGIIIFLNEKIKDGRRY